MDATILAKVHKLLRLSQSSNANEAALAASKAQELIDRHQLTQAMLALDEGTPSIDDEPIQTFTDAPLDAPARLDRWRASLAMAIARYNAVKIYCNGPRLMLIGRPSDAETVRYLYGWLAREVERLVASSGAGKGRVWRNNFRLGVVETIATKLRAQHDAVLASVRAEAAGESMALVRVEQAIATVNARAMAVAEWQRANFKLHAGRASYGSRYDSGAREAGRRAGQSISVGGSRRGLSGAPVKRIGGVQ